MTKPLLITDKADARAWFLWATANGHAAGCQCVGCRISRAVLAGNPAAKDMPQPA